MQSGETRDPKKILFFAAVASAAVYFVLNIFSQKTDGIRPASGAVPHLADIGGTGIMQFTLAGQRRRDDVRELVLRDDGNEVVGIDTHLSHLLCDIHDMILVYPGDDDRVDLHEHLAFYRHLDTPELLFEKFFCGLASTQLLPFPRDVFIDLLRDGRVYPAFDKWNSLCNGCGRQ